MTAEQRVRLVWPQAVREVRGGIVSPGIWSDPDPMADFLGETWEEVSTFDRVVKAHERYIRELSVPPPPWKPSTAPLPEVLRQLGRRGEESSKSMSRPNLNIYGRRLSTASRLCSCDLLPHEHEVCEHPMRKEEPELLLSWTAAQKACEGDYQLAYVEIERKLAEANRRADELAEQLLEMCKLATQYQNELWAKDKENKSRTATHTATEPASLDVDAS